MNVILNSLSYVKSSQVMPIELPSIPLWIWFWSPLKYYRNVEWKYMDQILRKHSILRKLRNKKKDYAHKITLKWS